MLTTKRTEQDRQCTISARGMAAINIISTVGVVPSTDVTTASLLLPPAAPRNVKVDKLPTQFTDQQLSRLFERFGGIESAKVMLNVQTGESRGYGFVLFQSHEAAANAVREINGMDCVDDQTGGGVFTPDVKFSEWNGECAAKESCAIYVRNIPLSTTEEQLRTIFSPFGTIVSITTRLQTLRQPNKQQHQQQMSTALSQTPPSMMTTATSMVMGQSVESNVSSIGGGGASYTSNPSSTSTLTVAETKIDSVATVDALHVVMNPCTRFSYSPPQGSGGGDSSIPSPPTEPLTKLATIQYESVDSARSAILATHRQFLFAASGSVPVLTKFANVLGNEKQQRHHQKQQGQPLSVINAPSSVRVGGHRRPPENCQQGGGGGHKRVQSVIPLSSVAAPPPAHPPSLPMATPSTASSMMKPSAQHGHGFPGEVPLPVGPRPGFQKIFYQGALGVSPDGVLYPIRPEVCYYEPTLMKSPPPPGGAPPQPTTDCPAPPCFYSFFPSPTGGAALWIQQPHVVPAAIVSAAAQQPSSLLFLPPPTLQQQPPPPFMAFSSSLPSDTPPLAVAPALASSAAAAAAAAQLEFEFPNAAHLSHFCFDSQDEDEDASETIET